MSTPRLARAEDAEAMARVHYDAWQEGYRGILPTSLLAGMSLERRVEFWHRRWPGTLVVEDEAGDVVGISSCGAPRDGGEPPSVGELYMINVAPSAWGTGVSRSLLDAAVRRLRDSGYMYAYLWVLEPNRRARRFYERSGWRCDDGRKLHERSGVMEVRYRRDL